MIKQIKILLLSQIQIKIIYLQQQCLKPNFFFNAIMQTLNPSSTIFHAQINKQWLKVARLSRFYSFPNLQLQYFKHQLPTSMKANLPINQSFENLKDYGSVSGSRVAMNVNNSENEDKTTREDEFADIGLRQLNRLQQDKVEKWQISFEKYFLAEHTATFKNQLQNFLEFALQNIPLQKQHSLETIKGHYFAPQSLRTVQDVLRVEKMGICQMHLDQFLKRIWQLQDVCGFLNYILTHCHQQLAKELIIISISIWIQFRNQDLKYITKKRLIAKSNAWVLHNSHSYFQRNDFTYLNFKSITKRNQISIVKQFGDFMKYFSATVVLILAGFFQNPYSKGGSNFPKHANYPKRQLSFDTFAFLSDNSSFSDEEESFEVKKRLKQW